MKSLPLKQRKSRAKEDGDGRGSSGTEEWHRTLGKSQGDVALPIPGVSGGDKWEPSEPGVLGSAGGRGRSSPPPPTLR